MNGSAVLAALPVIRTVAVALFHFLWQGGLIACCLALALAIVPRSMARLRYGLATSALALMATIPILTFCSALPSGPTARVTDALPTVAASASRAVGEMVPALHSEAPVRLAFPDWIATTVFLLWGCGVCGLAAYHVITWRRSRRLARCGTRPAPRGIEGSFARLRKRMRIARPVRLFASTLSSVPLAVGSIRPVVLLPASALTYLTPPQLEAILAHELAHIRRYDILVNYVQCAIETLLFYHPAVWWVSHQVRTEREHCCDDIACEVCGSPALYARALAEAEALRLAEAPRLAVGATGMPLLARVRRLLGRPDSRRRHTAGLAAGGAALIVAAVAAAALLGADAPDAQASRQPRARNTYEGRWRLRGGGDRAELRFSLSPQSESSIGIPWDAFPIPSGSEVSEFELVRDAGTFTFLGDAIVRGTHASGSGEFTFTPNPEYVADMTDRGFRVTRRDRILHLGIFDVSRAFIGEMADLGHGDLSIQRYLEFRIHGVTPEFIRDLEGLGYRNLSAHRLLEFRIHGVTRGFIDALARLGYTDLRASRLTEFRIHGVTPEFVLELGALGYRDLRPSRLVEFRIHGVTPEFILALRDLGYDNLRPSRLVEFRIHGVTPSFIERLVRRGFDDLSPGELVDIKIHGLDRYMRD